MNGLVEAKSCPSPAPRPARRSESAHARAARCGAGGFGRGGGGGKRCEGSLGRVEQLRPWLIYVAPECACRKESDKHYVCKIAVPLEKRFTSGGEVLRTLEEGEVFEVVEGPKTEAKEGLKRVRARDIADGSEGWFTLTQKNFKHWTPKYRCAQSTVINDAVAVKEAKSVRKLEVGETVEALETPVFDKTAGLLRVRVRAEKDGATGYATVRGNQGTVMLRPVTSDRGSKSSSD